MLLSTDINKAAWKVSPGCFLGLPQRNPVDEEEGTVSKVTKNKD